MDEVAEGFLLPGGFELPGLADGVGDGDENLAVQLFAFFFREPCSLRGGF